jgi:hypothetical protein
MKLRLRENSVRLRLTQTEVRRLRETGRVEERVVFGASSPAFVYALEATAAEAVGAVFADGRLCVSIPDAVAAAWADSAQVGIEVVRPNAGEKDLRITIEKDFACRAARPGEDDSDAFPPAGAKAC